MTSFYSIFLHFIYLISCSKNTQIWLLGDMNLKTEKSQQPLVSYNVHSNHITPHKQILLAEGLDEEQTQRYFGEAEEIPSHPSCFPLISFCSGGRAVLRSDQAAILTELCAAPEALTPVLGAEKWESEICKN